MAYMKYIRYLDSSKWSIDGAYFEHLIQDTTHSKVTVWLKRTRHLALKRCL